MTRLGAVNRLIPTPAAHIGAICRCPRRPIGHLASQPSESRGFASIKQTPAVVARAFDLRAIVLLLLCLHGDTRPR